MLFYIMQKKLREGVLKHGAGCKYFISMRYRNDWNSGVIEEPRIERRGSLETVSLTLKKIVGSFALGLAAVCVAAGTSFIPVSAAESAGASPVSASESAEKAGRTNKDSKDTSKSKKEEKEELVTFDEGIEAFFSDSGNLSDRAILMSAQKTQSDVSALDAELGKDGSSEVLSVMDAYEAAKVDYIMARINKELSSEEKKSEKETQAIQAAGLEMSAKDGVCHEWDLQSDYTLLMITEDSAIREMIPRYQITSCKMKDEVLKLAVDEWMTQGYGASDGTGPENASSYIYNFSLSLKRNSDGLWTPFEVNDTEVNFNWLQHREVDPEMESTEAPDNLYPVKSDADAAVTAYAQIVTDVPGDGDAAAAGKAVAFEINEKAVVVPFSKARETEAALYADAEVEQTGLETAYYDGYDADDAIEYSNKYWKHYNHRYYDYSHVGGDCCNFVSQCLSAGGMPHTDTWYPGSVAWINVPATRKHFSKYGMKITADNSSVRRGNPVYYDWQGDGVYDHTALCVGTNSSGMPVVNAHTTNVYHAPWRLGSGGSRQTILLNRKSSKSHEKNTWKIIDGNVYYLDGKGKKVKKKFMTIDGSRYYFRSSGKRASGFFEVDGSWYYASVSTGKLVRGWNWIGGKLYYFSRSSYKRYRSGRHMIGGHRYFLNTKGVRQTGFLRYHGRVYYAGQETGWLVAGWKKMNGKWRYFDRKTNVMATGWKTINGHRCYFNSKGILKKGKHG